MDENFYDNQNNESENFDKTQEMDSIQIPKLSDDERHGIMPRDEFTELNSADDMSKTLLMDSVADDNSASYRPSSENPVKRRKKKHKKKRTNHTRTMGQIFLGVVISVSALGFGVVLAVNIISAMRDFTGMSKPNKIIEFEVNESMGVDNIVDSLYKNGIIEMPKLFKAYVNMTKCANDFINGTFLITSNMSYSSIIDALTTEKEYTEKVYVFIPEGATAADIGKLLEQNFVCRASDFEACYKSKLNKYDFEETIKSDPNRLNELEGYIFPDTYEFYVIDDLRKNPDFDTSKYAMDAADKMFKNFESKITKSMKSRMKELGMSLDEVMILASLIQWEGTNEENMANVSSVFHNRLNDPEGFPNLQSDTTYTYIERCIDPRQNSTNAVRMQEYRDAYDTYKCEGLPVGAVCNPGMEAITAALYPADTDYYYFLVSKDGLFYYAQTLAGHEQNIIDAALRDEE